MRDIYALKRSYVWKWLKQMSDQATSENLRAEAARYHAEATEIETGVKTWELKEPPEQN